MTRRGRGWALVMGVVLPLALAGAAGDQPAAERPAKEQPPTAEQVFAKLDQDANGSLAREELPEKLAARFGEADTNQDGLWSLEEFKAAYGARPAAGPTPEGLLRKHDANQDGRLTQEELPAEVWAKLAPADADGDGALTATELKAALTSREGGAKPEAASADVFRKLDANGDGQLLADEVGPERWAKVARADADGDGAVTAAEWQKLHSATKPAGDQGGAKAEDLFARADRNQDGQVVQDEVPAEWWAKIQQADTNRDGAVTADEWRAFRAPAAKPGGGAADLFRKADRNQDGRVVQDEVPAEWWAKIQKADADGDGAVTAAEWQALHAPR